ncbi:MAG: glycoside hydrolase family 3 C-terminal domain-containing protein [Candidatus Marinimicrobia bacterium]|nr:glycoside hydrolase family 3 C-terminal domain-containing protein [Candidatus Neomarinimicrobiota bacterium]
MYKWTFFLWMVLCISCGKSRDSYKDSSLDIEKRIDILLEQMTLEEKFWQLFMIPGDLSIGKENLKQGIFGLQVGTVGAVEDEKMQVLQYDAAATAVETAKKVNEIQKFFVEETRLGIPVIIFDEALHGLIRSGATSFPQSIALAATFDTVLVADIGLAVARETRSRGINQILSPVVNIARDVRWGRTEETYGEDPLLCSEMGKAYISPFEKLNVITTPKHFVANVADGGRDSYPAHFNERLLKEIYYPAFRTAFQKAGARSVMTSYNSLDGIPCTANDELLIRTLKEEWGFRGFVISDANAVGGIYSLHENVDNWEDAGAMALKGGLDVIFQTSFSHAELFKGAVMKGKVPLDRVNDAVRRVLRAKFQLGLFENPYISVEEAGKWNGHPDHRQLALEAARKSIVLLKNENNFLPLSKKIKKIAVIGPDAIEARQGGYSGPGINTISILKGLKSLAKNCDIEYCAGVGRENHDFMTIPEEYLSNSEGSGLKGEYFDNIDFEGVPSVRWDKKIDFRWTFLSPHPGISKDWFSVRWTGKLKSPQTGKYQIGIDGDSGYRLWLDNKLIIDNRTKGGFEPELVFFNFQQDKFYDIQLEYYEPQGRTKINLVWTIGIPEYKKQIREAVALAQESQVAVVCVGINEGEFNDRAMLTLPGKQEQMINEIAHTGTPIIVVLTGGSAVTMDSWLQNVDGIIAVWYAGEVGGQAIAEVLLGEVNPSGKLPITFPKDVAQLPLYYNHKPTGRGDYYINFTGKPLFPFGYGLSYTDFDYGNLKIDRESQGWKVAFDITNTGPCDGDEVVQLYLHDEVASVVRPVLELKKFSRIFLKKNETGKVTFYLKKSDFEMIDQSLEKVVEPGTFTVYIGRSSEDLRLKGEITL